MKRRRPRISPVCSVVQGVQFDGGEARTRSNISSRPPSASGLLQQSTPEAPGGGIFCRCDMMLLSVRSIPPYWPEEAHMDRLMFIDEC